VKADGSAGEIYLAACARCSRRVRDPAWHIVVIRGASNGGRDIARPSNQPQHTAGMSPGQRVQRLFARPHAHVRRTRILKYTTVIKYSQRGYTLRKSVQRRLGRGQEGEVTAMSPVPARGMDTFLTPYITERLGLGESVLCSPRPVSIRVSTSDHFDRQVRR